MTVGVVLLLPVSAMATGSIRMEQYDKSVQTYIGVVMKVQANTLELTSPDGVSKVAIAVSGGDCWRANGIIYCAGGTMSLRQAGKVNFIQLKAAKFYLNSTDQEQWSDSLGAMLTSAGCQGAAKVAPHSVVFAILTEKGTHIIGNGKLD
jgi:hypothetical protein